MKSTPKSLLALLVMASLAVGVVNFASAATTEKKPVASKKSAKPVASKKSAKPVASKKAAKPVVAKKAKPAPVRTTAAVAAQEDGVMPKLGSTVAVVIDQASGEILYEKNGNAVVPIASITKLMTAMVALDAQPNLDEILTISKDDIDLLKGTHSRLSVGTQLTREEMLRLALMSSENRASSALSRHYPNGRAAFIAAMNRKAHELGLADTRFEDPTGLTAANVSSARDLGRLVDAAHQYPLIREFSTLEQHQVEVKGRAQTFRNTNALVKSDSWNISLSKTGYISEAGKCLVMQTWLNNKPTIIVLLDSWGKLTRVGDANRIKRWIESLASSHASLQG
jgi:D-alanyl-D-alanine endopeptidase (penicillin-binding protein 7)